MAARSPSELCSSSRITEQANPRTHDLDTLPLRQVLERILDEDATVPEAVREILPQLERASEILQATLESDGRWFNLGAGTSGRMGLIDAAEITPTFGLSSEQVQGVLAGGIEALAKAVEGAEDDTGAAERELKERGFSKNDTLVALSASGVTPFVLGGVEYARSLGAHTIGLTCCPDSPLAEAVECPIVVVVGPEAIAGSTRMKGGLAQKMVLHALSTSVMVRLGRVRGNLMTEARPVSEKLLCRAVHIITELADCDEREAERVLQEANGSVSVALKKLGL